MLRPLTILALLLSCTVGSASAAPVVLDAAFGGGVVTLAPSANTIGGYVAALPEGGVVVVATGYASTEYGEQSPEIVVAQLRADGSPDRTFDPTSPTSGIGRYFFDSGSGPASSWAQAFVRQSDGRLLIAGGTVDEIGILRLLANGPLDPTFGANGAMLFDLVDDERIVDLLVEPDGHILLGDDAAVGGGHRQFVIRRFDATGAVDSTFGPGGLVLAAPAAGANNQLAALVRWDDGAIGAVGVAFPPDDVGPLAPISVAVRLHGDGQPDEAFGDHGAVALANGEWPVAAAPTADGAAIVATSSFGALRLLPDGTVDPSFGAGGIARVAFPETTAGLSPYAFAVVVEPTGDVLLGGEAPRHADRPYGFALARLTAAGLRDQNFDGDGVVVTPILETSGILRLALDPNGGVFAGGFGYPAAPSSNVLAVAHYQSGNAGSTCGRATGRVVVRNVAAPGRDEEVEIVLSVPIAPDASIDPVATGLHLAASGSNPPFDVTAQAGAYDRNARIGWRTRGPDHVWTFRDATGASGVWKASVRRLDAQTVRVRARVRRPLDVLAADLRIIAELGDGRCGSFAVLRGRCRHEVVRFRVICH